MEIEYKMTEDMAYNLLKEAKIKDGPNSRKGQEYLCKVVNDNFGLKGVCTSVLFF